MRKRPRVALVLEREKDLGRWLSGAFDTVILRRDRLLSAELMASAPALIVMESVHPSEASWLLSWIRAQPRLAAVPLLVLVPFGPAPRRSRGAAFLQLPVDREKLLAEAERLLGETTPRPQPLRR